MTELQGLQLKASEFEARNTTVLAVVVDPVEKNADVVRDLGLSYRILSDPGLATIDAFGVRHREAHDGTDTARPATFLIDTNGVVRWRNLTPNYRLRPKAEEVVVEVDRLRGSAGG